MAVTFAPVALQDIEEIGDYIHAENPLATLRLVAALRARCAGIADMPSIGAPRPSLWPHLRSVSFRRYVIFYTTDGTDVRIERVLHGARDIDALFAEND
jgi:toxin ParE1/3/4